MRWKPAPGHVAEDLIEGVRRVAFGRSQSIFNMAFDPTSTAPDRPTTSPGRHHDVTQMPSATTPVEITVWFQVWMAYSPYGERYTATVDVDGRRYRAEMMRIYGKIDSSEVQGVDALFIASDATLPVAVADLGDPDV